MAKNNNFFCLIVIFFVFIFLRSYLLPKSISFAWDQERDATTIAKIIKTHTPTLIGPRVVGDNGFYLGPYFFYILLPFYVLTSFHPIAMVYFVVFIALLFFVISYISIKNIFNQKTALIFLSLWALLPICVGIDRIAWNPLLIPLSFSILLLLFNNLKKSKIYFIALGLILGLSFHLHFQALFFLIFSIAFLIKKDKEIIKYFLWLLLGFLFTFFPLLIFDFRHDFINIHLFINFFFSGNHSFSPFGFLPVWTNFIGKITGINNFAFSILFWLLLLAISIRNRKTPFYFASTVVLLLTPLAFAIYGKRPSEYYFVYLLPIIISIFSLLLSKIKIHSILAILLVLIFSFLSSKLIKIDFLSLYYKDQIVKIAKNTIKDNTVYISYNVPLGQNSGFDYLINYYQINRSSDTSRPGVQFLIPKNSSLPSAGNISLFVPKL